MTVTDTATGGSLPTVHESWLPREHTLYRPRHGGQRVALTCAVVFFTIPLLTLVLFGPSQANENRRPNPFPGIAAGWGFFTGLSPWADDHISFKAQSVQVSDFLSRNVFGEPPRYDRNDRLPAPGPVAPPVPSSPRPSEPRPQTAPPAAGFSSVVEGRDGWLYLGFDIQGKCQPSQSMDEVVANLIRLRQAVERSGRKFALVIAPNKTTMVPENMPSSYGGKECAASATRHFWDRMTNEVGIVDLRPALNDESVRARRPLYFRQDTHWMFDGGLIMTRALADRLQPGQSSTWRVLPGPVLTFPADLPTLIGASGQDTAMRYRFAPDGNGDRTNWINTDFRTPLTLQSSPVTGMVTVKTAMLADSYTQFASGYLAGSFANISITHVEDLGKDPGGVANRLADADAVVVEVVERHVVAGVSPITNPAYLNPIISALAARPVR
ncbi:MAG: alginate O-acetyltransferase AlgX-related protein [Labedaea sp.]